MGGCKVGHWVVKSVKVGRHRVLVVNAFKANLQAGLVMLSVVNALRWNFMISQNKLDLTRFNNTVKGFTIIVLSYFFFFSQLKLCYTVTT